MQLKLLLGLTLVAAAFVICSARHRKGTKGGLAPGVCAVDRTVVRKCGCDGDGDTSDYSCVLAAPLTPKGQQLTFCYKEQDFTTEDPWTGLLARACKIQSQDTESGDWSDVAEQACTCERHCVEDEDRALTNFTVSGQPARAFLCQTDIEDESRRGRRPDWRRRTKGQRQGSGRGRRPRDDDDEEEDADEEDLEVDVEHEEGDCVCLRQGERAVSHRELRRFACRLSVNDREIVQTSCCQVCLSVVDFEETEQGPFGNTTLRYGLCYQQPSEVDDGQLPTGVLAKACSIQAADDPTTELLPSGTQKTCACGLECGGDERSTLSGLLVDGQNAKALFCGRNRADQEDNAEEQEETSQGRSGRRDRGLEEFISAIYENFEFDTNCACPPYENCTSLVRDECPAMIAKRPRGGRAGSNLPELLGAAARLLQDDQPADGGSNTEQGRSTGKAAKTNTKQQRSRTPKEIRGRGRSKSRR